MADLERSAKKMSFLSRLFQKRPAHPEHAYRVWESGDALHCHHTPEEERMMRWDAVQEVSIVTTDEGPLLPDVFWRFRSANEELVFPQMALGEKEVLDRSMKFEGFDIERFTAAMSSAQNAEFVVWQKK